WAQPERVIELLKESPQCLGLLISLHGADARAHEAFTGVKGSFEETIKNICQATEAGLTVHTNAVLTSYNASQIEALVALSHSLGAECAVFNRYVGVASPDLALSQWALMQAIREVDRIGKPSTASPTARLRAAELGGREAGHRQPRTKFGTCVPLCFVESSSSGCLAGTAYCTIDPWGNLRPCNHAPQIAGNLLTQPLEMLWHSATMNAWRDLIPDECTTCSAFSTCHGGCRADMVLKGVKRDPLMTMPLPLYQ
ncbi:MAG: SPASM domain-containing protein, partial [Ardenticatenaceae bacterium]